MTDASDGKYSLKDNERDARERLRAFWEGGSLGRPALLVAAKREGYKEPPWEGPELSRKEQDLSPEWQVYENERILGRTAFLAEAMPWVTVRHGSALVLLAVLAGGDYEYHESAWIRPVPDVYERDVPRFDPGHPVVRSFEGIIERLAEAVGMRAFVGPPPLLDAMTTLSLLRTQAELCVDLVERPEDVRRWSSALTDLYVATLDHFHAKLTGLGYGESCTWLGVTAEGKMESVQCDFAVLLSPAMFEEFVLPDLARAVEFLDRSLYHLDGTCQMRFLDLIASCRGLSGIQWNPEPAAGSALGWVNGFKEIRRRGLSLDVRCAGAEEAVELTNVLGPDGLLLRLPEFGTVAEAEEAIRKIERAC
jgi:hypothetical protein